MRNIFKKVRNYPISCSFILFIWILCLIPIPENPLSQVRFMDKWTHFVFFGGLCMLIWAEYSCQHSVIDKRKVLFWIVIAPIMMGGAIEIVQATCTGGNRSGDVLDWVADTTGVILGQIIGIPLAQVLSKNRKGS